MKLELSKTNRQNIEDIYPLSPMQEGMLFESLYAPDSGVYFEQITCILMGNLDVKTFEQAWQQVVSRHPVFRTAFQWESLRQPVQVVYRQVEVTVDTYDWRELSAQEQQQQLETFLDSERKQGFQLSLAPLMRLHLIQLDSNTYQFVWCHHHLLLDGWSSPLVFKDLLEFYQAISQGKSLSNIGTVSYRNYIAWLQQQDRDLAQKFWRQKLQGFTTPTPLTVDKPLLMREKHLGYGEQQIYLTVPATAAVVSFVRQHQLTMSNLVQATWGLLLSRYSQETDVVFGATVSGRPPELVGVESMVGLFINTLPVRVQISEKTQLLDLLKDLQAQQLDSEQFSYSSLVEIQGLSDVPRGTSLFESIVVFENYPVDTGVLQGNSDFSLSNFRWIEQTNYPLGVVVALGEQLSLKVMYDANRFENGTISRMLGHFVTMLEAIAANPVQRIDQLPILTASEQQQLLVDWNDTGVDYPIDKCIHQLFEEHVELTPDAVAMVFENQQLTYHELNCRANSLAHYLKSLGVKANVLVGICVERSLEMLVGLLGILKAGGAYVPLDPEYPQDRLLFMLEDAQVPVLLTQQRLVERLPQYQGKLICLDEVWSEILQNKQDNPIEVVTPTHLANVIYTSGSTGKPKGVMVEHSGLYNLAQAQIQVFGLSGDSRVLQFASLSFDASIWEILMALGSGARLYLGTKDSLMPGMPLIERLRDDGITHVTLPPSALAVLPVEELPTLQTIIVAGEACAIELMRQWSKGRNFFNAYGPTEASVCAAIAKCTPKHQKISIGRPISNTQIYILDQNLQPVPAGVPGELHIGGAGLARGYLNRSELTQEKFIPNPFDKSRVKGQNSKLYKTGDLARYLPDGNIEYLERIDNQVKIRGFRIELGEIEAALSQHPHVQASCVMAREDNRGDKRLVAYIIPQPQVTPTISVLRSFLKEKLPEYMVPSAIVILESLPLTPNGKIDRRALPAPEPSSELLDKYVAPRTPIEEILALIWQQVLKVELVGRHDNFFELGGHSLLATQLVSRIRTSFKVELLLRELFARTTVAELAQSVEQLQQQDLKLSAPPILRRVENAELLSYAQQRLWFLDQFESNSSFYNILFGLRLVGTLNVAALEQSLIEIILRHEALRTNFVAVDGKPTQIIQIAPNWSLTVVDLQHLPLTVKETAAQELLQQQAIEPFDLAHDALIRATLIVLSPKEQWLLVCMHHIVSDGWSMGVFAQELVALYNAYSQGKTSPLLPLPIQYADFALWQRQWLVGDVLQSQLSYWQQQLKDAPALLSLPTDRPRAAVQTYHGTHQEFALSVELTNKLTKLSQEQGVTLFMTLLAAFDTLLYRYTGQEDILVGTPIANRDRTEIEGLIGFFVNTLVMRTNLSLNPSFNELLPRIRETALSAYAHQDLPFEMLVEALQPERDLSYTPLFQVMFVLNNAPITEIELTGLTVSSLPIESSTAKFDLTLAIENTATGLLGSWEYNTDLFDSSTIERMMVHFVTLLEGIVANPHERISQLPILTVSEQQQLLVDWNDTAVDYPQDKCIHQLFEEQVQRTPDAVAVVFENQQLTYHELNCRANQLAHYLQSLGVGADVLVGICVERSLEMIVGLLGIIKAGGAYVPLDPEYPQDRLSFMLADAQVSVLLSQHHLLEKLPEHHARVVCLDKDWIAIAKFSQDNPIAQVQTSNIAYVIYTSGSTGQPKGVIVSHSNLCNHMFWMQATFPLTKKDKVLQKTPFGFDASVWEFYAPLLAGGQLLIAEPGGHTDSAYLLRLIVEQQVTTIQLVPSLLQMLLEQGGIETCHSLKHVFCGGEALPVTLQEGLLSKLDVNLHNLYGPTEACIDATFWNCQREIYPQLVPIGRPIDNTQIYILDQNLQPVPVGVSGELHIGGAGLAKGYLNRPELTQEKFIPNPFEEVRQRGLLCETLREGGFPHERLRTRRAGGSRLYKTGDLARYLPDGNIEYLGRIDNQVKIRGFRIELGEIEAALSQHKDVKTSVVIIREDIPGNKRLVAYVVPQPHITPTVSILRSFLKEKLPDYMVPNAIVTLESLPLTPNGKLDRCALPAPDLQSQLSDKYVAPRNPIEEILSLIWAQVLKVEQIGIHDNFFELGGHSLLATQLVSRIRTNLKVELSLRSLFAAPTIAQLAPIIQRLQQQDLELIAPPILKRAENAQLPLSYAQQRLWFLDQFEPNSSFYNIPMGLRLVGSVNIAVLEQSLIEIIHRHEALRTNFITVDGKPTQIIQTQQNWTVAVVDLQYLPWGEQEIAAQKLLQQQAIEPFDLAEQALIRATLVILSETEQWLLVCMHHVVSDGWSRGIFVQELQALYNAYSQSQPSPLLPLPIQYADFALWQRQWLQGEVLNSQLSYWKEQLANAPTFLPLPTDRPRPAVQTFNGAYQKFALSVELTQQLTKLSQQQGCTMSMTLLAAYNTLLYRYTGVADILVGTPITNRDRTEIEGLIGFFVNTLVMRTDLSLNPSFNELLLRIRETALSAYAHQDLPFDMLVEALQPERDLSYTPLFQVMFDLNNAPITEIELTGLCVSELPIEISTVKVDLTLSMENTPGGLFGWWQYNTDLFDSSTIERMTGHFVTLLEAIVANPEERISQLPMLTAFEQQQLLVEWNDTGVDYAFDKCIHQLFEEQVELTPDDVAVVYENQYFTYRELNCRANQLAHYLKSLGVKADVLVGICVERSLEMVVGLLGILKAGGAYVPLKPEYPTERLTFILEDTHLSVILTQEKLVNKLGDRLQRGFAERKVSVICLDSNWDIINQQTQQNPTTSIKAQDLAYVMYTSGSTGQPKGVSIVHQGVVRLVKENGYASFSAQEVFLQFAPITFDAATFEIWGCLLNSGRLIIFPPNTPSINELGQVIEQYQVTTLWLTAGLFHLMVDENIDALKPLHQLLAGGDILSVPHVQKFLQTVENCQLINGYGPTENTTFTCCYQIPTSLSPDVSVPIGRPIANTQVYILDKYLQPLPIGVPGELYISGTGLARGYFNRPELTQEKFIPNPFEKARGSKLYKTGDLARYLADGNIEYLGRIDNQVKIRGFRIELGEIEAVLSQYANVQASCVIACEDIPGDKYIVAYIVPQKEQTCTERSRSTPSVSELRSFLKSKLPEYMLPSAFVILDALPLTPNGKLDRCALPAPDLQSQLSDKYVVPRNPIEEILSLIWAQVLKVEQIGIHDNFFELGGHSLLATQLVSRIRTNLKVELSLRSLFAAPTIAQLAPIIQRLQQQDLELIAPPILKRAENVQLPLSYAQQRLWFLDQFEPNSASYNIPVGLRLVGTVNVVALEQSLIEIIHRHEALRTNFVTVDGKPTQIIQTVTNWSVAIVDLQHLPTSEQEITAQQLVQQQASEPFDLASDALIRATLVVLSPTQQWLLVCMHHVVSDGWSMSVFVQELQALYNAYSIGQPSTLLSLPIQYADFALWQRQWLVGEVLGSQLSYWKQQLANAPTFLPLPTDKPRPAVQTFNGAHLEFSLSVELTQQLVKLSHEQGCTLFMTLLAAYNTLLYRYTGQEDILVGTPIANRDRSEIEGLIGFFVNTLVMRTNLAGNPIFNELLPRIREMALSAYAHQDLPFEMLVEALQPERDISHTPLFQVMFVLNNAPTSEIELTGLSVSSLPIESSTAKFDLTLGMENTSNGLFAGWEYNSDLFDGSTIERMTGHFVTLLEAIVANPEQRISQLPMLTASEQQQLLVEWNTTQVDYPQDKCIHQLFEEQVERTPDAVAVVFKGEQLTYHQLNCRANQLAHYLRSLGVGADVLVGICVERSLEMVVGLLGILKAGGAYVPLDPEYPQDRLSFMLEDAQLSVLLTQQHLVEKLQNHQAQVVCLDTDWHFISQLNQDNLITEVQATNLVYVIYTSGSTGTPKGVLVAHKGLLNLVLWHQRTFKITSSDKATQLAGTGFDAAAWELWPYLTAGASIHLVKSEILASPVNLRDWLISHQITISFVPTPITQELLSLEWTTESLALRYVLTGGDKLNQYPPASVPFQVVNNYGPTENTVVTTSGLVVAKKQDQTSPSIGRPISNTYIYILDKYLQPVPIGVPGELHISGAGLARGYLNRSELTQEKFIPNPFDRTKGAGERLYKTGDLARYLPDGNIEYLGRIDNQIKIRGFRIELGEIEAILSQHPGVRENVVVAREDIPGEKRLVAYFVPQFEQTPTTNELRIFLKEKLPQYMVPSAFVTLECLPLTPNGKVDRKALPVPDSHNTQLAVSFVAPRTFVEKVLADIWANVLHLKQVGVLDNFFELGGHSLSTIRVMSQINETFQIKLPLRHLFTAPTIALLAQTIESTCGTDSSVSANEITSVNLQAEVVLDETIKPLNLVYQPVSEPKAILLTGATGFVGAFLLAELLQQTQADIYCLVRAANLSAGKQRLQETLKAYLLWEESFSERIIPVLGDLSQPLLGLGDEQFHLMAVKIDLIYHNGALVNHVYPYALLKAANVRGTEEVLRLASQIKIKPVHFISTISVFSSDEYLKLEVVQENDPLEHSQGLVNGYTQSKWVAEKIVMMARDRGLPCSIYRLGRITWHSQTGVWNLNDMFYRFIKACIQLKSAPEMNSTVEITPVDYLAKALICLSQQPESLGKAFHLMNSHSAPWSQFINCIRSLGYPLQQLDYEDWQALLLRNTQISSDNALYSAISLAEDNTSSQSKANAASSLKFDCQNTLNGLADTDIRWSQVDDKLLQAFFANFSKAG